ncbi:MAG: 4Fe-4S dicluster domain-containing protein [bacterium]|nr:4Fe-4S dicluster domain-containing protein [bacterium]
MASHQLAAGATEGREVFEGFGTAPIVVFYLLTLVTIAIFTYGFWRRFAKYRTGRAAGRLNLNNMKRVVVDLSSQRTIGKRDPYIRVAHFLVFWGFIVLLIGTTIIAIDEDIFGFLLNKPGWQFWHGAFYVGYALVLDLFGIGFIVGLLMLANRRRSKPFRLDYGRVDRDDYDRGGYSRDDRVFLGILLSLGVSGFLIEGFRIVANDFPSFERVSIAGYTVALLFSWLGEAGSDTARVVTWWFHAGAALAFVAYIPYSKAMHIVVDAVDLLVTNPDSARSLPAVADPASPGYQTMESFTWKEYLDFDACTKCGRCHEVCPARTSGAPLSPRDFILDLREAADSRAGIKLWYGGGAEPRHAGATEVAGSVIATDTLWACTTCMACMEVCPVGIEHVPTIVELRRRLVDVGDVEPGLQNAFQSLTRGGNSFGKSAKQRARWTKGLDFTIKDLRKEPAEYLWFVGDQAAFDPRAAEVSRTVAQLFHRADLDFGLLYEAERNSGNDVRRAGEEGLFEMLRDQNRDAFDSAGFQKILTTDPHSLNTLRHEYDLEQPVVHYSQILDELVSSGRLSLKTLQGRATYHDPCYLGRYAEEYDAPRRLIAATGLEFVEMGRCRENSFCCGAGGGRIWMDDSGLEERPAENRIREAVALGDDVRFFVVACPKDMVMYTDAVKTTGNEGRLEVVDIAQLVGRALETEGALAG